MELSELPAQHQASAAAQIAEQNARMPAAVPPSASLFEEPATEPSFRPDCFICRVVGTPKPQGSTRAFVVKSKGTGKLRAVITRDSVGQRPWRDTMAFAFVEEMEGKPKPLFEEAVEVTMHFLMPRPKALRKGTKAHVVKPDIDKLLRAVADSLAESRVLADDSMIVSIHACKRYAEVDETPGLFVIVKPANK